MGNSGAKKGSNGDLQILEARYGWAGDIWAPEDCSHGAGCKDVTEIVRNDVKNGELHLNPSKRGQYFNQHFWPETAHGPAIPRKVAIRYMYVGGPVMELTTAAVSNETVCVHITSDRVEPHPREVTEKNILSKYILSENSINFVGVWKDSGGSRGFPQHFPATGHGRYDGKDVIREFNNFISDLEKSGEKIGYFGIQYGCYVGWVCGDNKQWQKHGKYGDSSNGDMSQRNAGLRVQGFNGVMNILGGPWQNAVYEVRLSAYGKSTHNSNRSSTPGASNSVPKQIKISNANTCHGGWPNDTWNLSGECNGRPQWQRRGNPADYLRWEGNRWTINGMIHPSDYFQHTSDTYLPPKTGWKQAHYSATSMPILEYEGGNNTTNGANTERILVLKGAGRSVVNGEYKFHANAGARHWCRGGQWKQIDGECWIGFQDCRPHGHPEWNKWMVYHREAIVYAAHTHGKDNVDPREGGWEIAQWASEHQTEKPGEHPPPKCHYKGPQQADQNSIIKLGNTPSHGNPASTSKLNTELNNVARNTNDTDRARKLVGMGADLSSTNGPQWRHTPLHQASYHGRLEMARTLVELGADLNLHSNPCGRGATGTPIELARGGGHHAIVTMLEQAMKGNVNQAKQREVDPGAQLHIHEARYGWAGDIWAPKQCSHGAGCKDVTDIVQRDVRNNEVHLNPHKQGNFFNQHFWPETAMGPPIPRKVAIRYSYGNGPVYELVTAAVPGETVCVHITPERSDPSSREIDYNRPQRNDDVKNVIKREFPDVDDEDIKHAERAISLSMRFTGKERLLGSGRGIPAGNDPYTIEMLIKAKDSGTIFFSGKDARNKALGICVHKRGDQFTIQHWWHRNDIHTDPCFKANEWQQIAATWDGHTRRVYANKKFVKEDHPGSHQFPHGGGKIMIGTDPPGRSHNYRGEIAEIRVWRKCLSSNELGKAINDKSRVNGLARWLVFDSVDHSRGDFSIQDRVNDEILKSVLAQPTWVGQPQPLPKVEEHMPSVPSAPAQTHEMMSQLRELINMKKQGFLTDVEFSAAKRQLLKLDGRNDSSSPPQYDQAEGYAEGSVPPGGTKTSTGEIGFE